MMIISVGNFMLLLAISIISYYAIFSALVSPTSSALGHNITRVYDNYSISGNSINVFSFNSTPENASVYFERSSAPLEVFLLNGSGYGLWRAEVNSSATSADYLSIAKGLEGRGALIIYDNATNATIPVTFSKPIYSENESNLSFGILGAGRFYVLSAVSPYSTVSNATVKSALAEGISLGGSANKLTEFSLSGIVVTLMLIAALIIILVGIMKQDTKKQAEEIKPEVVDALYKGIKGTSSEELAERKLKHKAGKKGAGRRR
ncbi:hypothetical protein M1567_01330 [Candidatus Marsarchaeota archaeon]|nr:hypothetical protein [Candidatus Marsarchaeota archaeon]